MDSIKGRLKALEKMVEEKVAPRKPSSFAEAHVWLILVVVKSDADAAARLAAFARSGVTSVTDEYGYMTLDWK